MEHGAKLIFRHSGIDQNSDLSRRHSGRATHACQHPTHALKKTTIYIYGVDHDAVV